MTNSSAACLPTCGLGLITVEDDGINSAEFHSMMLGMEELLEPADHFTLLQLEEEEWGRAYMLDTLLRRGCNFIQ